MPTIQKFPTKRVGKSPIKRWWQQASPVEKATAAKAAKTTVGQLGQLVGGHRNAGPALARRIEIATGVPRTSLCRACKACEFAKACKG